jgi:hypothetical protein
MSPSRPNLLLVLLLTALLWPVGLRGDCCCRGQVRSIAAVAKTVAPLKACCAKRLRQAPAVTAITGESLAHRCTCLSNDRLTAQSTLSVRWTVSTDALKAIASAPEILVVAVPFAVPAAEVVARFTISPESAQRRCARTGCWLV